MRHCSFCSLLCSYENEKELAACSTRNGRIAVAKSRRTRSASLQGRSINQNEAIGTSRNYLQSVPAILVTGHIVSLETSREVLKLARRFGATVDLKNSQSTFDWIQALQAGGGFTTTINEARFRSDLIVLVGDEKDFQNHPCLIPQVLDCPAPLRQRSLLFLGNFSTDFISRCRSLASSFDVDQVDFISVHAEQLGQLFSYAGNCDLGSVNPSIAEAMRRLRKSLDESENAVFVFSTAAEYANGVEVYRSLNEYILNVASEKKVSALPLSSSTLMFSQCCTWLTGFPGRIVYVDGVPQYNPWLYTAHKWFDRASKDALVIDVDERSEDAMISMKHAHDKNDEALIQIPVAISGAECVSTLYKADGSTMIRCGENSGHPSAASILQLILADD